MSNFSLMEFLIPKISPSTSSSLVYDSADWLDIMFESRGKPLRFIGATGQVYLDNCEKDNVSVVIYNDGFACKALQRKFREVEALGYPDITNAVSFANFIHESIHLFLSEELVLPNCVTRNQAQGESFEYTEEDSKECKNKIDAIYEETLVIGFQCYVNDITEDNLKGFNYFLAKSSMQYAEMLLFEKYGRDIKELRDKFIGILSESNKNFQLNT